MGSQLSLPHDIRIKMKDNDSVPGIKQSAEADVHRTDLMQFGI